VSSVRILTVEDYEPYRRFVSSALQREPELHRTLNGLEAARLICKVCSASKIIFLSQESSAQVIEEVFSLGASGYIEKTHAGSELLVAVKTVLQGKRFVSAGLVAVASPMH
jgi:DNA-binding NarL/FixJ family response regulator